jgi:nucleotide-binding universal stress UspA family protein
MGVDLLPPPELTSARAGPLRARIRASVGEGAKITILQGDPAQRILGLARLRGSDLIVVGTHGREGLRRVLLGSTAEAVIGASPVPVLAARGRARTVRSILAPVNFTDYSKYGCAYAAAAAAVLSARLKVLHVTDDPVWSGNVRYQLSAVISRLPAQVVKNCRPAAMTSVDDAVRGILKARKGHDWIVLVAHGKSLIKDALLGTTLEQVLRRSPIPVLAVPEPSRSLFSLRIAGGGAKASGRSASGR